MTEQQIEQTLAEVKAKNAGDLTAVETDIDGAEVLVFRVPTSAEWQRYRIEVGGEDRPTSIAAMKTLVLACCVFPERAAFESAVAAHPGLIETCHGPVVQHAGANRAKKVRKL